MPDVFYKMPIFARKIKYRRLYYGMKFSAMHSGNVHDVHAGWSIKPEWRGKVVLAVVWVLYALTSWWLSDTAMFWDSISIFSRPATVLYDTGFSTLTFPEKTVTDNLPLSTLLAFWWCCFGRSLFSTHVLFFLFGTALLYQLYKLCAEVLEKAVGDDRLAVLPWVFLLVVSDTTLVTQLLVPMFDTVLMLAAVYLLRAILQGKAGKIVIASVALSLLRSRGIILCFAFALFHYGYQICFSAGKRRGTRPVTFSEIIKNVWHTAFLFLPALLTASALLIIQRQCQEVIFGLSKDSPWTFTSMRCMMHNAIWYVWCHLDMGKLFLWLALAFLLLRFGVRRVLGALPRPLLLCYLLVSLIYMTMTVPFQNPFGARYFLLLFLLFALMVGTLIFSLMPFLKARLLTFFLILMLWGGHLMRYPEGMAVSWDSTLSHLPYYTLREDVQAYLTEHNVEPSDVRMLFPYEKPLDLNYLDGKERGAVAYRAFSNSDTARYIVYSNLSNVSRTLAGIDGRYTMMRIFKRGAVYFEVWRRVGLEEPLPVTEDADNMVSVTVMP